MNSAAYKSYLLWVLLVILAFTGVDGLTLGLVLQNIKLDLALSDTQLGVLSGIAFALFYSVMGIPLARWADSGNRVTIIFITTALSGVAIACCGFVGSFVQLLSVRVCVAVGEAGSIPTSSSLISDYFSRAERPRAMARYMLASPLSCVVGYFLAGWLNESYGWRTTFILLGLPGLGLAVLARLTLIEPRRARPSVVAVRLDDSESNSASVRKICPTPSLREICATLWSNRTFRHLLLSFAIMTFCGNGTTQWLSTFFIRSYGLGTGELGTWFAVIYGVGGALGNYLGGEFASRYAAGNERLQLWTMACAYIGSGMLSVFVYLSPNHYVAFGLIALSSICSALTMGPLFAVIQALVPGAMRAQAMALVFLFSNLIGMGLGPLAVGSLSDALRPWAGDESLRFALLALSPTYLWIAWHLWRASRTVTRDIELLDDALDPTSYGSAAQRINGRAPGVASAGG